MGWRGQHNRELMLEEERRAAFGALPRRTRLRIRLEQTAFAGLALAVAGFIIWWKWTS